MNKPDLRQQMRAVRAALSPDERMVASAQVEKRLRELAAAHNWRHIAVYLATKDEVNLDNFITWLLMRDVDIYAPHDNGFAPLEHLENVTMGNFGVREPQNAAVLLPPDTVFLIPGLAFDKQGGRLGFGGGWYDRALAHFPQSLKIGIAFNGQIVDKVPHEAHDVKMNWVVTPSASAECKMQN